jgi:hypothetical protein
MPRAVSFGGGLSAAPEYVDPQRAMRQRAMADALTRQSEGPISGWGQGVANLARTAAAGFLGNRADQSEKSANQARAAEMQRIGGSGDPLAALLQSQDPEFQQMGLQYQMAKALKDPGETYATLTDEEERAAGLDPAGTYQRSSAGKVDVLSAPTKPEAPTVKDFYEGGQVVQKQYDAGTGQWVEVGRGGRWQPQQAPGPSDRAKRALEAGLVEGTPEYNAFVLSSDQAAANPKQENILRDEFNALTKDFRTVQDAYSKIESTSDTGAGDMSMLYSYVKLLDPGSVVRESEFATAAASGSFGEQVQGAVQRIMTGERLPPTLRAAFKGEAKSIFQAQKAGYERLKTSYGNLATRTGVPTENVIVDYAAPETVAPVDLGTQTGGPGGIGAAPAAPADEIGEGTVIVNPQTKERLVLKGGQWVPAP